MKKDLAEALRDDVINGLNEKYPNLKNLADELNTFVFVEKEQPNNKVKLVRANNEYYIYPDTTARDLINSLYDTVIMSKFTPNKPIRTGENQIEKIIPSKGLFFEAAIRKHMVNSFCEKFSKKEAFKSVDFSSKNSTEKNIFSDDFDLEVLNGLASQIDIETDELCELITEKHLNKSEKLDYLFQRAKGDRLAFDKIEISLDYALEAKMIEKSPFTFANEANKKCKGLSKTVKEKADKCLSYATNKCVLAQEKANKLISENKFLSVAKKQKDNAPKKKRGLFSRLFGWLFRRRKKNKEAEKPQQVSTETSNATVEPLSSEEIEEIKKESVENAITLPKKDSTTRTMGNVVVNDKSEQQKGE